MAWERVVPGEVPEHILAEHLARYRFARVHTFGKSVLDVACGSGYGARLLAESGTTNVVGVDASEDAVAFGRRRFSHPRLAYLRADAERLPFREASFECAVCFETIEHASDRRALLSELARVLTPRAVLLLSTPNRRIASPWWPLTRRPANPHHHYEYTRAGLRREVLPWFEIEEEWGQRFVAGPWQWLPVYAVIRLGARLLWSDTAFRFYDEASGPALELSRARRGEPRYFLLVCRRREREPVEPSSAAERTL